MYVFKHMPTGVARPRQYTSSCSTDQHVKQSFHHQLVHYPGVGCTPPLRAGVGCTPPLRTDDGCTPPQRSRQWVHYPGGGCILPLQHTSGSFCSSRRLQTCREHPFERMGCDETPGQLNATGVPGQWDQEDQNPCEETPTHSKPGGHCTPAPI